MAEMIRIKNLEDNGAERLVYKALGHLPDDYIVYYGAKLTHDIQIREPDFLVVSPERNVLILEVKGWYPYNIQEWSDRDALLYNNSGGEWKTSPVTQAKKAAYVLEKVLKQDPDLFNKRKLFSYSYAGVLPILDINSKLFHELESAWGRRRLLGRQHLEPDRILEAIKLIPPTPFQDLNPFQIEAIRKLINPGIKFHDKGRTIFADRHQEALIVEPTKSSIEEVTSVFQQETLSIEETTEDIQDWFEEDDLPDEAKALVNASHVRLVRGVAGSGKTIVLVLRTRYLHEQFPEMNILVTSFNKTLVKYLSSKLASLGPSIDVMTYDKLCKTIVDIGAKGKWSSVRDITGIIANLAEESGDPRFKKWGIDFLVDEFTWMKETGRTDREVYVTGVREGRGKVSRRLTRKMKTEIFDLFEVYQMKLNKHGWYDWMDIHELTLDLLNEGTEPEKYYDYILIDEAQHFAPTWISIIKKLLKPDGGLFISDDPTQSVYRYFSWKQKGIEVRGRTRWLKVPYRNTRQIFEAARSLVENNPTVQSMLSEDSDAVQLDLTEYAMREGTIPGLHFFHNVQIEKEFIASKVAELITLGVPSQEIAILHEKGHVVSRFESLAKDMGIIVSEMKKQTGMEYSVVFIPQLQQLFTGILEKDFEAKQQLKLHVVMSRARQRLFLLYEQKLPKAVNPILPFVERINH